MAEKRLAYKDFARLRRFVKAAAKGGQEHREWMEEQADKLGCYIDKWFPRAGFWTGDDNKRVKVDETLTKEARRRDGELRRLGEKVDNELARLAERLRTYPDLIDVKTGKVTKPEGVLAEASEETEKSTAAEGEVDLLKEDKG